MVFRYLSLFLLYINTKIGKNKCLVLEEPVALLYRKQLFTWLSLVVSLMASFLCCPFFPLDVLDRIWDLIESVFEGFLTYPFIRGLIIEPFLNKILDVKHG